MALKCKTFSDSSYSNLTFYIIVNLIHLYIQNKQLQDTTLGSLAYDGHLSLFSYTLETKELIN